MKERNSPGTAKEVKSYSRASLTRNSPCDRNKICHIQNFKFPSSHLIRNNIKQIKLTLVFHPIYLKYYHFNKQKIYKLWDILL